MRTLSPQCLRTLIVEEPEGDGRSGWLLPTPPTCRRRMTTIGFPMRAKNIHGRRRDLIPGCSFPATERLPTTPVRPFWHEFIPLFQDVRTAHRRMRSVAANLLPAQHAR